MKHPALASLLGLILLMPVGSTRAQEPSPASQIFIPVVSGALVNNPGVNSPVTAAPVANADESQTGQEHSQEHGAHDHIGHIPEHGRFTANDGHAMSWPPQMKYIRDVAYDESALQISTRRASEVNAVSAAASLNPEIQALLGQRYVEVSAVPLMEKWDDEIQGHRVTYFSYSNNMTVEAVLVDAEVTSVESYAAAESQPPLGPGEKEASVAIARDYWQSMGNTRVNELEGFVIQTFLTEGEGGYYDTRMTYVSFHVDEVSHPELLTWVDLTTETVFRAVIDDGGILHEQ